MMGQQQVTLYTTPTCPYCRMAKRFLQENRIPFREVDLTVDIHEQETVYRATGTLAVPQINVNGRWIVGYDPARMMQYLHG